MKYMHKDFYNMPIPTLVKVIQNNQLTGFPCMTITNAKKYMPPLPVMRLPLQCRCLCTYCLFENKKYILSLISFFAPLTGQARRCAQKKNTAQR